jgi:pilus assembly protein CpaB
MNSRLISVLVFALVVSAVASFFLYRFLSSRMETAQAAPTGTAVIATRPLPIGTLIKDADVKVASWGSDLPAGAVTKVEDAVGRGVVTPILEKEPLVDARLAPKGGGAGLAATIPQGMRAVAVSVNEVVGVAGFATPGMHVDVLVSGNPPGIITSSTGPQTHTVLQNIEVLSAGQNFQKDAEGKPVAVQVVNLLVNPDQAEILSLASHETHIQLVLRNPLDHELAKPPGTAVVNLFNGGMAPVAKPVAQVRRVRPTPPPAAPKPPDTMTIEVYHGDKRAEFKFAAVGGTNQ